MSMLVTHGHGRAVYVAPSVSTVVSPVGTAEELEAVLLPLQHGYRSWDVLERDDFSVTQARKTNLSGVAPIPAPEHDL